MTQQSDALRLADALDEHQFDEPHAAAAELRRLHLYELACTEWLEKTEWVQNTARPGEFGMHRADILNERIGQLKNQRAQLLEALKEIYDWTAHQNTVWATKASAAIKAVEEGK